MVSSPTSQIVLASRPKGPPQLENFRLEQVAMPAAPAAFIGMLEGRNFGKALVRVALG
jgi:NADPH-dependent curcumin reductase CurA